MKRIKLTHGSARVDDNCSQETIKVLDKMSKLAYNMDTEVVVMTTKNKRK